jgi:molecular chaperone DnaK
MNCNLNILYQFQLANKHFSAIGQESEWKSKIVHLITGVLEYVFPISYIIALFDQTVFKDFSEEKKAAQPLPLSSTSPKKGVEQPIIIGIDLGTTNSCVAYMKDGTIEVIPDTNGARTTSSIVSFKDGESFVGTVAKSPSEILYSTKRFIGCKYEEVASEMSGVPYKVIKNENGDAVFEINGKVVTPEDAGAQILLKMKQIAERHLGKQITKAIVTVPAYFNDAQRQATREAGRIAGLDVVKILAEPTAAAIAYGIDKTRGSQKVAIYDLGGGTFDVSILNIEDGIFEVRSTNGDTHLGGDDFDSEIVKWIVAELKKKNIELSQDKQPLLIDAAKKAKIALSTFESTKINLPDNLSLELTRAKLEELCRELIGRSLEPCEKAMKDAHLKPEDIDQVVLVGGMTRMPAVREAVKKVFNRDPNTSVNPDEAVAIGAAIQGSVLAGDPTNVLLIDVTPLTLGIETKGGIVSPVITRNTSIPTSRSQVFSTATDNQASVKIQVFQGERPMACDNKMIASFELDGIPPAPRGIPQIEVTFNLDGDGILKVQAKDRLTGKKQNIRVASKSGLTMEEIDQRVKEAKAHEAKDKAHLEAIETAHNANALIQSVQQLLDQGKISDPSKINLALNDLKKALEGSNTALIKEKTQELEKYLATLLFILADNRT